MAQQKTVRIGNAGGYWGDDPGALMRQLQLGPLDYLTQDYLAEITMSILQKQKKRNPELGYAVDFVDQMRQALPLALDREVTVISNAGGINPQGCAAALRQIAEDASRNPTIAVIEGDDLMARLDALIAQGHLLENMETGAPITSIRDQIESANVYLGAAPVIQALNEGAQVVVCGRVTDTGISVAAPASEFGWTANDWDRLASAVVAGHILECGAQASGGNLTDWREVPSFQDMAYPIAEFTSDGSFLITKHGEAGGLVNRKTVVSQLVYEMGAPSSYLTPDVIADFSTIELEEMGPNQVRVSGVKGRPRPETLKVSVSYRAGFKAHGTLMVSGPDAVEKCHKIAEILWQRLAVEYQETSTELVGYNSCHPHLMPSHEPSEILLRLGARDDEVGKISQFAKQFPSLILSSMPGVAIVGARPRIQNIVAYWPCLIDADEVEATVTLLPGGRQVAVDWPDGDFADPPPATVKTSHLEDEEDPIGEVVQVALRRLAYGRSGDKGDTCNIGIVARTPAAYRWLKKQLTAVQVAEYFKGICKGEVERFDIPNLLALNFLLHESLGGGGTISLGIDPQGKTLADALLNQIVEVPAAVVPG